MCFSLFIFIDISLLGWSIDDKAKTSMRETITPKEKLSITFRCLRTVKTFERLMYQFRVHQTTIAKFAPKCAIRYILT